MLDGTRATDLTVVLQSKVECKAYNTLCLCSCGDLQALYYAWVALVLETGVFALCVFTDDGEIDIVVTSWEAREGFAEDDGSVDIELLAHGDIP